jgi:hypothetical protein
MIIRVAPSAQIERILKRNTEDPEDSPMEFLDQRIEAGENLNMNLEIPEETHEKDFAKQKSHDKIREHFVEQTMEAKRENINHGKANDSGLERN